VARRCAQPFVLERRGDLLRRAPEQIERPEQLDVGVAIARIAASVRSGSCAIA